jgi:glycosyltransferase involved in cell wall biosynthesis
VRILAVQETDWIDRNPVLHHRMLEDLSRSGHEVTVVDFDILWHKKSRRPLIYRRQRITNCHKHFDDSTVAILRPTMLRLPGLSRPTWLADNWLILREQLRSYRPDVVVGYSISNSYLAMRLAAALNVPFVYHVLDALHTLGEPPFLRHFARPVEKRIMRSADEVIVVNSGLRDYAVTMGANPRRLHVIPMGVDQGDLSVGQDIRPSLGLKSDDIVMMFMGWLYRFSGLLEVTTQLARRSDLPHLKLLVVGDGDLLPVLGELRYELGLGDRLILTGRRPAREMPDYLASADICLLPAQRNATMEHIVPAKVIEYMQAGKAIVATSLPGLRKEFGDLPGITYVSHPDETVDRVIDILGPPSPRDTARLLGDSCRQFIAGRPTWQEVTRDFEDVLLKARSANAPCS